MKLRSASKSSLFLLELLFSILFFILAAALCVQVFVKARLLSRDAQNLTMSHNLCENAASLIRGSEGTLGEVKADLLRFFPGAQEEEDSLLIYYDSAWEPSEEDKAAYTAIISLWEEQQTRSAQILIVDSEGKEIYLLPLEFHLPLRLTADRSREALGL